MKGNTRYIKKIQKLQWFFVQGVFVITAIVLVHYHLTLAEEPFPNTMTVQGLKPIHKKINFISTQNQRTPNPSGWEAYDGSIYTEGRGYGWLTDLSGSASDRGSDGDVILSDGTRTSPRALDRLELSNWQGTHQENQPLIFRIDLPDGWYWVTCTSVEPVKWQLPLVNQRSIKFRAHDVVFAGSAYGTPLKIEGNRLVEGSGIVEVTEGHLRIVVGDPAYGGWTWSYEGPWHRGWRGWLGEVNLKRYAKNWYQIITRTVDPGYHSLRFNSLEVEQVTAPTKRSSIFFRDFFNRDDNPDVNSGLVKADHWDRAKLHSVYPDRISSELYKTSLKLTGSRHKSVIGLVQQKLSPRKGIIRYSTRVSLFTGEGSQIHSGIQEAGLLILGEPTKVTEFNSTFIGVAYDRSRSETSGWVKYRVGNGQDGYRTDSEVPDTMLPFDITEGEYEIIVEHDVAENILSRILINGVGVTDYWTTQDRKQQISHGLFGIRASMDDYGSGVNLRQFYWYYRVEDISS